MKLRGVAVLATSARPVKNWSHAQLLFQKRKEKSTIKRAKESKVLFQESLLFL